MWKSDKYIEKQKEKGTGNRKGHAEGWAEKSLYKLVSMNVLLHVNSHRRVLSVVNSQ